MSDSEPFNDQYEPFSLIKYESPIEVEEDMKNYHQKQQEADLENLPKIEGNSVLHFRNS